MLPNLTKKQRVIQKIIDGNSLESVKKSESVSSRMITKWLVEFVQGGRNLQNLEDRRPIVRHQQLQVGHIEWLYHVLRSKSPKDLGLEKYLWNGTLVEKAIRHWCYKEYPGGRVYSLLKDLGFDFENPLLFKLTPEVVRTFREAQPKGYQAIYLDTYDLKLCFKVSEGEKGGAFIIRKVPTATNHTVLYSYNLDKNGIRFTAREGTVKSEDAIEFIERLTFDYPSSLMLVGPAHSVFSKPEVIRHVQTNCPQLKIYSVATQI